MFNLKASVKLYVKILALCAKLKLLIVTHLLTVISNADVINTNEKAPMTSIV